MSAVAGTDGSFQVTVLTPGGHIVVTVTAIAGGHATAGHSRGLPADGTGSAFPARHQQSAGWPAAPAGVMLRKLLVGSLLHAPGGSP